MIIIIMLCFVLFSCLIAFAAALGAEETRRLATILPLPSLRENSAEAAGDAEAPHGCLPGEGGDGGDRGRR